MEKIPLISSSPELRSAAEGCVARCGFGPPEVVLLDDSRKAMDYLSVELPEIAFLHFDEAGSESAAFLERITHDPWLIRAGIIAICDDEDTADGLEGRRGANLVAVLGSEGLERQLPRLLDILHDNRRILLQREIGADLMGKMSGQFLLHNDLVEARCYTNLICSLLFYANRIDGSTRESLHLALTELLTNAIEHGNCEITYEDKTRWLANGGTIGKLIEKRHEDPAVARRKVLFEYAIEDDTSRFLIADDGDGFDWRGVRDATGPAALLESHGRGILMTRAATANLKYSEKGNEVRFEIEHQRDRASVTPGLFGEMETREVREGEEVFRQDEPGSFLYFIAAGRYDVIAGDTPLAQLTPDDIFMGEMSFLLSNRRTATVRASTRGRLIEISKRGFVEAIRRHPHYALLLARLLAQRIARFNELHAG